MPLCWLERVLCWSERALYWSEGSCVGQEVPCVGVRWLLVCPRGSCLVSLSPVEGDDPHAFFFIVTEPWRWVDIAEILHGVWVILAQLLAKEKLARSGQVMEL